MLRIILIVVIAMVVVYGFISYKTETIVKDLYQPKWEEVAKHADDLQVITYEDSFGRKHKVIIPKGGEDE